MQTYPTYDAANANADLGLHIVEIEHRTDGRCHIRCKVTADMLRKALANKPIADITAVYGSRPVRATVTEAMRARDAVTALFARAEALVDSPAAYLTAYAAAEKALAEWRTNYPAEAAEADAETAREAAEKTERVAAGHIARGID